MDISMIEFVCRQPNISISAIPSKATLYRNKSARRFKNHWCSWEGGSLHEELVTDMSV